MKHRTLNCLTAFMAAGVVGSFAYADPVMPTGIADSDTLAIRKAIQDAGSGTVELGEGTFLINDAAGLTLNGVKVRGQGWGKTILKSDLASCQRGFKLSGGAKLEGVTVTGFNGSYRGAGVYVESGTLSWCCVSNNNCTAASNGNAAGAGIGILGGRIDHCLVADNKMGQGSNGYGAGIGGWGLKDGITIDSCLIYGNQNTAKDGAGIGFATLNSKLIQIRNCTVVDNVSQGTGAGVFVYDGQTANLIMKNCIVSGNTAGGAESNLNTYSTFYPSIANCIFGLASEVDPDMTSCQSGDPGFVNAADHDYHLDRTSLAASAGVVYADLGTDLDDVAFASVPSVGCYEATLNVSKPMFAPAADRTFYPSIDVTLTCAKAGATIRYTTDGSDPTAESTVFGGTPIHLTATTTIKAQAFLDELDPSVVVTGVYTLAEPTPPEMAITLTPWMTSATIEGSVTDFGNNGASACDVYLAHGPADGSLGNEVKIASDVTRSFKYNVNGLSPETDYQYSIRIVNNADTPMSDTQNGTFTTLSASVGIRPSGNAESDTTTIQSAIDATPNGTVTLAPGTFKIIRALQINNGASLVGIGTSPDEVVLNLVTQAVTDGNQSVLVIQDSADTVVSNLTVTAAGAKNGNTEYGPNSGVKMNSGLLVDCVVTQVKTKNGGIHGGGVNMSGSAIVRGCTITKCEAYNTAGSYGAGEAIYMDGGLVENCVITENGVSGDCHTTEDITAYGGTVYVNGHGVVRGCLIYNNIAHAGASGVSLVSGVLENCTIANNRQFKASSNAPGVRVYGTSSTMRNNIIWDNVAFDGSLVNVAFVGAATATLENNDSMPALAGGSNNIAVDPQFINAAEGDYHTRFSYCVDVGLSQDWMTGAVDLDGHDRVLNGSVDLGCYEREVPEGIEGRFRLESDGSLDQASVTFEYDVVGGTASSALWTFTRQQDQTVLTHDGFEAMVVPTGIWDVSVTLSDGETSVVVESAAAVEVRASTVYANANGSATFPYDTEEKGTPSIDDAFPLVGVGGTLYIAEGSYVIDNPINIEGQKGSCVESLAGPEKTIVRLNNVDNFLSNGYYGLQLARSDAYVSGITMIAGRVGPYYDGPEYATLGFVKVTAGGAVVTNCVFRDLMVSTNAAGSGNEGVALRLSAGEVVDCRFTRIDHYTSGNAGHSGGVIRVDGGVADRICVDECWDISDRGLTPTGCGDIVGVLAGGVMRNSLVTRCTTAHTVPVCAGVQPGGTPGVSVAGSIINCTIVANTNSQSRISDGNGVLYRHEGGVEVNGGTLVNSIVADNWSEFDDSVKNVVSTLGAATGVSYTLVNDAEVAEGFVTDANHNIAVATDALIFNKPEKGDYRPHNKSLAVNAAQLMDWMATSCDLEGNARILNNYPDIGCYELRRSGFSIRFR